jgi:hypothetical protein
MDDPAAFEHALARALTGDGPLPAPALPAPGAEVAIVVPPEPAIALALAPLIERLAMGGVHRGRLELVLAAPGGAPASTEIAERLRARLGVRVHVHDPASARTFPLRLADDTVVGVDDVLRECEALVLAGALDARGGIDGFAALLTPGLADPATRIACGAARPDGRSWGRWAADALGVELVVGFDMRGRDARAWVGDWSAIATALAQSS